MSSENIEKYLDVMFQNHQEDIEAIKSFDDNETGIVFRSGFHNQKHVKIEGKLCKVLYVGKNGFGRVFGSRNTRCIIYRR